MDVAMLGILPIVGSPPGQVTQVMDPSCSFEAVIAQLIGQPSLGTESKVEMGSVRAGRQEIEKTPDPSGQASQLVGMALAEAVIPSQNLSRFVEKAATEQADKPIAPVADDFTQAQAAPAQSDRSDMSDVSRLLPPELPPQSELPPSDSPVSDLPLGGELPLKSELPPSDGPIWDLPLRGELPLKSELPPSDGPIWDLPLRGELPLKSELPPSDGPIWDLPLRGELPLKSELPPSDGPVSDLPEVTPPPERAVGESKVVSEVHPQAPARPQVAEAIRVEVPAAQPADPVIAKVNPPQPVEVTTDATAQAAPQPIVIVAENEPVVTTEVEPSGETPKARPERGAAVPRSETHTDRQPLDLPEVRPIPRSQPVESRPAQVMEIEPIAQPDEGNSDQPIKTEPKLGWMPIEVQVPGSQAVKVEGQTDAHLPPQDVIQAKVIHQIVRSARMQAFDGGGSMTLRLAPPHLGTIRMDVTAEHGVVTANLSTSNESVRQILESDLSTLNRSLADAGVHVDAISVQTDTRPDVRDNLSQSLNWQGSSSHAGSRQGEQQYPRMLQMQMEQASETDSRRRGQFDFLA
jgi:hypothetical protein